MFQSSRYTETSCLATHPVIKKRVRFVRKLLGPFLGFLLDATWELSFQL